MPPALLPFDRGFPPRSQNSPSADTARTAQQGGPGRSLAAEKAQNRELPDSQRDFSIVDYDEKGPSHARQAPRKILRRFTAC